jgi:phage terminase large subunit GpA-like protein
MTTTTIDRKPGLRSATEKLFGALRPPPNIKPSQFAQQKIRLAEGQSATPGRLRLYPYQPEMLDVTIDPAIERVTFHKAARLGMSLVLYCAIAHYAANDPASIITLLPRETDARNFSLQLEEMFHASPEIATLLDYSRLDSENRSNMLHRQFPGGSLRLIGANAPDNLRAITAKILIADEVSAFPASSGKEGDPLALATTRTNTYGDRKIIACSTPLLAETCGITRLYEQSDKRVWQVPCKHCDEFWEIKWADIQWPQGEPEKACCICPACGGVHEERDKLEMVNSGRWHATAPHVKGHAGFHISALASLLPSAKWCLLAKEFLRAKGDSTLMQAFVNTVLGEVWKVDSEGDVDPMSLEARAEAFGEDCVPPEVLAITAGVDVQRDRLERSLLGHREDGGAPAVIGHEVFWGDPLRPEIWEQLKADLNRELPHACGGALPISGAAIDAGDGVTAEAVYRFAGPYQHRSWFAIKGSPGASRIPFELSRSKVKNKYGARLALVGAEGLKTRIIAAYSAPEGKAEAMRFSANLDPEWFDQLTAERRETVMRAGRPITIFKQVKTRNEALDCTVYALAIWAHLKPRFSWEAARARATAIAPKKPKRSWRD